MSSTTPDAAFVRAGTPVEDREEKTSRRELNKLATRAAIIEAAVNLLSEHGLGGFTAEDLADAAGISRRTFFNYFPSPEAALAATVQIFLDGAIEEFRNRPHQESVLDSAIAAVTALVEPGALSRMARVCLLTENQPQVQRWQLMAWDEATGKLSAAAVERLGTEADPFFVRTMVGAIIGAGKAAMEFWLEHEAPRNGEVTDAHSAALRRLITQALQHLRNGFA
ncbi:MULTISPECIES: TetR family transcriptional regulator [Arthrobacter]|uniref:TetR family transcriptional regulator n=2 Tax=Arthrobacter TaxID=1663 RepID=A0ABU9KJD4_9MICC|nr:TetR family transcriptional regulator [Arthrobacter sp. YJM1]MDP5226741.1 TetR family transcriptional regulator [Arthrobacter sp. YJM1]